MKRLIRYAGLPSSDRWLLLEAAAALASAEVQIRAMGFSRIAARLGRHMAESPSLEEGTTSVLAERVQWAVERVARVLPWKPVCLPQAVAATRLLRRRGISSTLYLGVDPTRNLDAHAWVRVGDVIVTGGPRAERFTVVSTFS